jgi:hypothetical protein
MAAALLCLAGCLTTPRLQEVAVEPADRDKPAVAHYKQKVENDLLGPIWYRLIKNHIKELNAGTVKTTFEIPAGGGKPHNLRIVSHTGGSMDTLIARQAIEELQAPSLPPEVLAEIDPDYLVFEESFTIRYKSSAHTRGKESLAILDSR